MEAINYKGYVITPNLTGYVNFDFYHPDDELISGHGSSIEQCKKKIDQIIFDNEPELDLKAEKARHKKALRVLKLIKECDRRIKNHRNYRGISLYFLTWRTGTPKG